jgi:hypothetical protein
VKDHMNMTRKFLVPRLHATQDTTVACLFYTGIIGYHLMGRNGYGDER